MELLLDAGYYDNEADKKGIDFHCRFVSLRTMCTLWGRVAYHSLIALVHFTVWFFFFGFFLVPFFPFFFLCPTFSPFLFGSQVWHRMYDALGTEDREWNKDLTARPSRCNARLMPWSLVYTVVGVMVSLVARIVVFDGTHLFSSFAFWEPFAAIFC